MRLIDEKDTLPKIDEAFLKFAEHDDVLQLYSDARLAVINAPTIDPESLHKKGEWIHPKGYVVTNGFVCSECGHCESSLRPIKPRLGGACIADENGNFYYPPNINFCPNCGADMRGEEE